MKVFRLPRVVEADSLREETTLMQVGNKWYVARPLGQRCLCLFRRIHIAYKVFVGDYDALVYIDANKPPVRSKYGTYRGLRLPIKDRVIDEHEQGV